MMSKHKHHIIPRYRCKELGIDPDFDENIVEVDRLDHARIHWGYKCDDLEPLFEYITPAQWIIDLIPRGDNRDVGAAVINARGEIDGIDISGENHPMYGRTGEKSSNWKGGIKTNDPKAYMKEWHQGPKSKSYMKTYRQTPERKAYMKEYLKEYRAREGRGDRQTPEYRAYNKKYMKEYRAINKSETQGEGTLETFLK
jgi:hypothetical protein